ncbi:unnamed protein product [Urochloa humidicola]
MHLAHLAAGPIYTPAHPSPFLITSEAEHKKHYYTFFLSTCSCFPSRDQACLAAAETAGAAPAAACGCGSGCGGCKMFPDVEATSSTTTRGSFICREAGRHVYAQ